MVEIDDIYFPVSLKQWLGGQSREVSIWIVWRISVRVLPIYWRWVEVHPEAKKSHLTALPILRFFLMSEVAYSMPSFDIKVSRSHDAVFDAVNNIKGSFPDADAVNAAEAAEFAAKEITDATADAAARAADADPAIWRAIRQDCEAVTGAGKDKITTLTLDHIPLWHDAENPFQQEWDALKHTLTHPDQPLDWGFWIKWYDSVLTGEPLNGDVLAEIAGIGDEEWEKGEAHIAQMIGEIENRYDGVDKAPKDFQPSKISASVKADIFERVQQNRESIALSIAGVMEQISEYKERVRGINQIDPAYRDDLFEFLDELSGLLNELLGQLPDADQDVDDDQAEALATWGQKFKRSFSTKAKAYVEPDNVAGAALPTGIILGCTAIGAVFGPIGAGAGGVIGKLITGELKPAKAAEALTKTSDDPPDVE